MLQEARPARREVLAGILATGAALGFSQRASADPIADAQGVVEEAGMGIKRRIDGLFGKDKVNFHCNSGVSTLCSECS